MTPIAAGFGLPQLVAALVALQRVVELAYARRNMRALLTAGGVEHGARHYPLIVGLHAAWLLAVALLIPADAAVSWALLGAFVVLQGLRLWTIRSLGRFWSTRVITVPGAPLVRRGPYRLLRHPNYCIVAAEIGVLPLAFGAWEIAVVATAGNGLLLLHRIGVENRALAARSPQSKP